MHLVGVPSLCFPHILANDPSCLPETSISSRDYILPIKGVANGANVLNVAYVVVDSKEKVNF
jgi:hypothetical protein